MKIKMCGLTRYEDAEYALHLGVDYLGFIFYPKSPRFIDPREVALILDRLSAFHFRAYGVCVNESAEGLKAIQEQSGVHVLQLHGDESPHFVKGLEDVDFLKCVRVTKCQDMVDWSFLPFLLVDGDAKEHYGGCGIQADWDLIASCKDSYVGRLFLGGGLSADNVVEAIRTLRPYAVDVSSGVEVSPGVKDHGKMKCFVDQVRSCL